MRRTIGLTMRVHRAYDDEDWDCIDQQWTVLLSALGFDVCLIPTLVGAQLVQMIERCDGLVLTGGNDLGLVDGGINVSSARDAMESEVLRLAGPDKPILGVCRGAQQLAVRAGGQLRRAEGHERTTHPVLSGDNDSARMATVNSYHRFVIASDPPLPIEVLAWCPTDGTVEMFRVRETCHIGVMWHPERLGPFGRDVGVVEEVFGGLT